MMFDLFCARCRRHYLLGARGLHNLHNLAPGMILLELVCPTATSPYS
jgi:hypothetical protein